MHFHGYRSIWGYLRRVAELPGFVLEFLVKDSEDAIVSGAEVEIKKYEEEISLEEQKTEEDFTALLESLEEGAGSNITAGTDTAHKYTEDASLFFETHGTGVSGYTRVSVDADLTGVDTISFYYDASGMMSSWREARVDVNGIKVWSVTSDPADWTLIEIDVSGYEGICTIEFGLDTPDGTGNAGNKVWYDLIGEMPIVKTLYSPSRQKTTDGEGKATFPNTTTGLYEYVITKEGYPEERGELEVGEIDKTINVLFQKFDDLEETASMQGSLEDIEWVEIIEETENCEETASMQGSLEDIEWEEVV